MRDVLAQLLRTLAVADFMRLADHAPYRFRLRG